LRAVAIPNSEDAVCASHPGFGPLRKPFPIGPVCQTVGGGDEVLHQAPDDRRTRDRLLDLIEDIEVINTVPLGFRESVVIWQLRALGEPRAFVHLDRIEPALEERDEAASAAALPTLSRSHGQGHAVVQRADRATAADWLSKYSLAGRLWILVSLMVGIAVGVAALYGQHELLAWLGTERRKLKLGLAVVLGAAAGAVCLRLGRSVFARFGMSFDSVPGRVGEEGPGDGAAGGLG